MSGGGHFFDGWRSGAAAHPDRTDDGRAAAALHSGRARPVAGGDRPGAISRADAPVRRRPRHRRDVQAGPTRSPSASSGPGWRSSSSISYAMSKSRKSSWKLLDDPSRPCRPARRVHVGEVTLSVHEAGPADGVPVLLLHGWPELAISWAAQITALSQAGYRVIAPDNRGFGASAMRPMTSPPMALIESSAISAGF
jgi:hypothetical protein